MHQPLLNQRKFLVEVNGASWTSTMKGYMNWVKAETVRIAIHKIPRQQENEFDQ